MSRAAVGLLAFAALAGCENNLPFRVTVVAAGADPALVKIGTFDRTQPLTLDARETTQDGCDPKPRLVGVPLSTERVEIEPLQIDGEQVGEVTVDYPRHPPQDDVEIELSVFAWVDADDDGRVDVSSIGEREVVRGFFFVDNRERRGCLTGYGGFWADGIGVGSPRYSETHDFEAVESFAPAPRRPWMAVLEANTEPAPDADADGLVDDVEFSVHTSHTDPDTDADGEGDAIEVGDDPIHPHDTDGDAQIDALESTLTDEDGDGVDDEHDPGDFGFN